MSRRHPAVILHDLDFAHDICLLESSLDRPQTPLIATAGATEEAGLIISTPRTKYMKFNIASQTTLTVNGEAIKEVNDFK